MGTNNSPDVLRGFLVPHDIDQTNIDEANSSYTQSGNRAGDPEPQQVSKLVLRAIGQQTSTSDLQIKTQRAGHPSSGGQFVWVDNAVTSPDYGRLLPSNISNYDIADYASTSSFFYKYPNLLALDDGSFLVSVYVRESGVVNDRIMVYTRTEDDDTYSRVTVSELFTPFGGLAYPETYPAMCRLSDGNILLIYNVSNGVAGSSVGRLNFRAYISTDDGVTWSLHSDRLIEDTFSIGTGSGEYTVEGLQIASINGQVLMLCEVKYGTSGTGVFQNRLLQFASVDGGQTFTRVTSTYDFDAGFHRVRLSVRQNAFYLVYIAETSEIHGMSIPHAFFSVATGRNASIFSIAITGVTVETQNDNEDMQGGELALVVDDDDIIYIYFRNCQLSGEEKFLARYSTDGIDWGYMASGVGNAIWYGLTDASGTIQRPKEIQAVGIGGRVAIGHNYVTGLLSDETLSILWMGGYSSLTLPYIDDSKNRYEKATFNTTYIPYNLPNTISEFTVTGTGTDSINLGRLYITTTSLTHRYYTATYTTTTLDEGLICRCRFDVALGGSSTSDARFIQLEIGNGTVRYGVKIRISATNIYMIDLHGSSIANTTIGSGINDVIIAISDNDAKAWICTDTKFHTKNYTQIGSSSTLSDGGGGLTGGSVSFGHGPYSGSVNTYFYEFMVSSDERTGVQMATTTPDLAAMNYPPSGKYVYIADGVKITTVNGPATLGDEYNIVPRYDYAIDNVFYDNQPSTQIGWRSASVSAGASVPTQEFAFDTILDSKGSPFTGNGLMAVHLQGINFSNIKIYAGSGFTLVGDVDNKIDFFYDVAAGAIVPNSNNTATGPYISYDECKDWAIKITDGSTTVYTRIKHNTEGTLFNATGKKPIFYVEDTVPSSGSVSSRVASLIPPTCTVLLYMDGNNTYDKIGIRFSTTPTPEDYIECNHMSIGPVVFPGQQYARGRTISKDMGTIVDQTINGTKYARNLRPSQRTLRISWADPIDITTISGDALDPGYWSAVIASTDAVATDMDVPLFILGLVERLQGSVKPLVYLPKIDRLGSTGNVQAEILKRQDEQILGLIVSDVSIESVLGSELNNEIFRVSTITIEEVI